MPSGERVPGPALFGVDACILAQKCNHYCPGVGGKTPEKSLRSGKQRGLFTLPVRLLVLTAFVPAWVPRVHSPHRLRERETPASAEQILFRFLRSTAVWACGVWGPVVMSLVSAPHPSTHSSLLVMRSGWYMRPRGEERLLFAGPTPCDAAEGRKPTPGRPGQSLQCRRARPTAMANGCCPWTATRYVPCARTRSCYYCCIAQGGFLEATLVVPPAAVGASVVARPVCPDSPASRWFAPQGLRVAIKPPQLHARRTGASEQGRVRVALLTAIALLACRAVAYTCPAGTWGAGGRDPCTTCVTSAPYSVAGSSSAAACSAAPATASHGRFSKL